MKPDSGPDGENFFICDCELRPLKGITSCSLIVDAPTKKQFGYLLKGWDYATY